MIKKLFYYLPSFLKNIILILSSRFYNDNFNDFINNDEYGGHFNINSSDRRYLLKRITRCLSKIESGTSIQVQIFLIKEILKIKKKNICVVECGCFKGSSTVALSIACKLINAKLIVYDSFEGLPFSEKNLGLRNYPHLNLYGYYRKGMYLGKLEEVKENLKLFGEPSVCEFRKGYFERTLKNHKEIIDFAFFDVDLTESTRTCIKHLWKKLRDKSYIYTDDACDLSVAAVWFDDIWWKKYIKESAPGYVGSGCGLPSISNSYSSLGYAYKNKKKNTKNTKKFSWLKNN
jgi:O-methyltransferase